MTVLWNKEIEKIKQTGCLEKTLDITDALIENFINSIMKEEEKELLSIFFKPNVRQEDLDELLKKWDIEVKHTEKNLLLAYYMKYHPEFSFNSYTKPRLTGLLNNVRFKNIKIFSHYVKIGKALNENQITPMLIKGGAMRYLRSELPRIMGDIDVLVKENEFLKSISIAKALGYTYEKIDIHSVDLHDNEGRGALDIHKFIYMNGRDDKKVISRIFKRAVKQNVFGVETLIPSNEDMVFIILNNLSRNLRNNTSRAGTLFAIFDFDYLVNSKKDFDWDIVAENARITGTQIYINFALKFIGRISPYVIRESLRNTLFEKETREYSLCVLYKRFYLEEIREKSRGIKIKDIFRGFSLIDYLKIKPKYFLLKQLIGHPVLIKFFIKDIKTRKYNF